MLFRSAVNGGGQNQVRAILAGALVGAQVGLSGIPQRFIDGLEEGEELRALAVQLAGQVDGGNAGRSGEPVESE